LELSGYFVKDKKKERKVISKLLYYDEGRYSKRYCDLKDEYWSEDL